MSTDPEELINKQIWEILQEVKVESLVTEKDKPVEYEIGNVVGVGIIYPDRKIRILRILQEQGAWKLEQKFENVFHLHLIHPQFEEIYKKYKIKNEANIPLDGTPVEIFIVDLEIRYAHINKEINDKKLFLEVAEYGRFLNSSKNFPPLQVSLHTEFIEQTTSFRQSWGSFFKIWKSYAMDIIEIADAHGIADEGALENEFELIKVYVNEPELDFGSEKIDGYFDCYRRIIHKFDRTGKIELISKKHLTPNNEIILFPEYDKLNNLWESYKKVREFTTYWAHYQISRLANGVFQDVFDNGSYFKSDKGINAIYQHEFNKISQGNTDTLFFLKRENYERWIKQLHSYIISRLKNIKSTELENRYKSLITSIETKEENQYKPSEPPPNIIDWRQLTLDINQHTISYKNNAPYDVSFGINPVKFLLYLFDHPRAISYLELAKNLELNCYHAKAENKDVKREVQDVRKNLITLLKDKVKMEKTDLADLIFSEEKFGYKIGKE